MNLFIKKKKRRRYIFATLLHNQCPAGSFYASHWYYLTVFSINWYRALSELGHTMLYHIRVLHVFKEYPMGPCNSPPPLLIFSLSFCVSLHLSLLYLSIYLNVCHFLSPLYLSVLPFWCLFYLVRINNHIIISILNGSSI